ncbi:MAG: hypothetical protein OXC40_06895, partial [Proteobacteria bacterium]|nr:hypothetical protein [Pseudomonadota bacterium]
HYQLCLYYLKMSTIDHHDEQLPWGSSQSLYWQKAMHMAYQITLLDNSHFLTYLASANIAFHHQDLASTWKNLSDISASFSQMPYFRESYDLQTKMLAYDIPGLAHEKQQFIKRLTEDDDLPSEIYQQLILPLLKTESLAQASSWIHQKETRLNNRQWQPLFHYLKAEIFFHHGLYNLSEKYYQKSFDSGLRMPQITLNLATVMLEKKPIEALTLLDIYQKSKDFTVTKGKYEWSNEYSEFLWLKGLGYLYQKKTDKAEHYFIQMLQGLIQNQSSTLEATSKLSMLRAEYENQFSIKPWQDLLHKLTQQLPQITKTHKYLGLSYQLSHQNKQAIKHLSDALIFAPDDHQLYQMISRSYEELGNLNQAFHFTQNALASGPSSTTANYLYDLGSILAKQGREQLAIEHLQMAFTLNPQLKRLALTNKSLSSLWSHPIFKKVTDVTYESSDADNQGFSSQKLSDD